MLSTTTTVTARGTTVTEVLYYRIPLPGATTTFFGETSTVTPIASSSSPAGFTFPFVTITTTNGRGKTVVEGINRTRFTILSTILSDSSTKTTNNDRSISTGAIAGIVVGVVVALAIILALLLLLRRRRRQSKTPFEIAGEEPKVLQENRSTSRRASRKENVLPTWKSELSGETQRAELDGSSERRRTELDGARSPTELDTAALSAVETSQATADERIASPHNESYDERVGVDAARPPPIPYASKPRPG